jgi:hypothetical protein
MNSVADTSVRMRTGSTACDCCRSIQAVEQGVSSPQVDAAE